MAALVFASLLPDTIADYGREPEDVWLGAFWIGALGSVAALCFANALGPAKLPRWRILANSAVLAAMAVLLVVGRDDPAVPPLLALCLLGPLLAVGSALQRGGRRRLPGR